MNVRNESLTEEYNLMRNEVLPFISKIKREHFVNFEEVQNHLLKCIFPNKNLNVLRRNLEKSIENYVWNRAKGERQEETGQFLFNKNALAEIKESSKKVEFDWEKLLKACQKLIGL